LGLFTASTKIKERNRKRRKEEKYIKYSFTKYSSLHMTQNKQKKTATPSSPRKCRVWTYR